MRWSALLALGLALLPRPSSACLDCGGPVLTDARGTPDPLLPGELALVVNVGGAWLEEGPGPGPAGRSGGDTAFVEVRPVLSLGFSHRWSVELQVPLRHARTWGPAGGSRAAVGFGDPALSVRMAAPLFAWTLVGSAGATLPVGSSGALDPTGRAVTVLGAGTATPIASLELTRSVGPAWLRGSVLAFVPLAAGKAGTRAKGRVQGSVFAELPVSRRWLLGAGVDVLQELPGSRVDGRPPEPARTRALVGASARLWLGVWSARFTVKAAPWERGAMGAERFAAMPLSGNVAFETRFDVGT